jgi:AraC family transcriptional regulator
MKITTKLDYRARIERVLAQLTRRLDDEPTLAELAGIACFSAFHFHRVFQAITGETVAALIRRLRLERAAYTLRSTSSTVTQVALDAQYGSPEAFTRAFQQAFGVSPSAYRDARPVPGYQPALAGKLRLDPQHLTLSLKPVSGGTTMDVRLETLPGALCICVRHLGPYHEVGATYQHLVKWAAQTGHLTPGAQIVGLSYDDPGSVAAGALRYDACLAVPGPVDGLPPGFRCEQVAGGRYAIHRLRGPYSGIDAVFRQLFGHWLPDSGETVDDRPCMELYLNDPATVPAADLLTDICIPLKPA